ncbi:hypothetical protein GH714_001110 [Hevea brasiliensis]|uniref:Reverse transcriptase Ty1/copia-type domain-containing protein n=1 Tax=Hevea brasiliensis TaxID=3981 RepID=A0A6A6LU71_HEVBR|nr:hypothetical protein GH714_001110 [Hevea brasiliensis]
MAPDDHSHVAFKVFWASGKLVDRADFVYKVVVEMFALGKLKKMESTYLMQHTQIRNTTDIGLTFNRAKMSDLVVDYVDLDFTGDLDKRTGYLFTLSGSAISWKATLQANVASSTTESEYMVLAEIVKEAL